MFSLIKKSYYSNHFSFLYLTLKICLLYINTKYLDEFVYQKYSDKSIIILCFNLKNLCCLIFCLMMIATMM